MHFEVFIPAANKEGYDVTLNVEAENWMVALKTGLQRCGQPSDAVRNVMCDIQANHAIHVTDITTRRVFKLREVEGPPPTSAPTPSPAPAEAKGAAPTMLLTSVPRDEDGKIIIEADLQEVEPMAPVVNAKKPLKPDIGATITAVGGVASSTQAAQEAPERPKVPMRKRASTIPLDEADIDMTPAPSTPPETPPEIGATVAAMGGIAASDTSTRPAKASKTPASAKPIEAPAAKKDSPAAAQEPEPIEEGKDGRKRASTIPLDVEEIEVEATATPPSVPSKASRPKEEDPWPKAEEVAPKARVVSGAHTKASKIVAPAVVAPAPVAAEPKVQKDKHAKTVMMEAVSMPEAKKAAAEAKRRAEERRKARIKAEAEPEVKAKAKAKKAAPKTMIMEAPSASTSSGIGHTAIDRGASAGRVINETRTPTGKNQAIGRSEELAQVGDNILEDIFLDIYDLWEPDMTMEASVDFILDLSINSIKAELGSILFAVPNGSELYVAGSRGPKAAEVMKHRIPMGKGIVGFCTREGVSLTLSASSDDPRFSEDISHQMGVKPRSVLCAPITHVGRVYGCIELVNPKKGDTFGAVEANALAYIGQQFGKFVNEQITSQE